MATLGLNMVLENLEELLLQDKEQAYLLPLKFTIHLEEKVKFHLDDEQASIYN